jgi:hypothetical protein
MRIQNRLFLLSTLTALCAAFAFGQPGGARARLVTDFTGSGEIKLTGPGLSLTFARNQSRLALIQMQRRGEAPLLYQDQKTTQAGPGPAGNPLAVIVHQGPFKGVYGMDSFHLTGYEQSESRLLAYLQHDKLPLTVGAEISVEGSVARWYGQTVWNGDEAVEMEIYFPILSRVRLDDPEKDRALVPQISGSVRGPMSTLNYVSSYLGRFSSPTFLVEGGTRGIAVVDDNRADLAPDPSASSLRSYIIANTFPLPETQSTARSNAGLTVLGGEQGPYIAIRHTRYFHPKGKFGGIEEYRKSEGPQNFPLQKYGDGVDLGPVRTYAYAGNWKTGALWLRTQRRFVPMRKSSAEWFERTSFLAEGGGRPTFFNLPEDLRNKQRAGSDLFFITGFSKPEVFGSSQSRGDYTFPNQDIGGYDALKQGIDAVHRAGGRVMFYVEGMIQWKRSRIGRTDRAEKWALMEPDGSHTQHYRGFWHGCPADRDYREWLAESLAELVKSTGVDGFFIDSTLATYNHRCFNPAHNHPHPDVWNWGIRQMLKQIREEVDKVNPNTVLFVEGGGDLAREYVDGFLSHGHGWTSHTFTEPFVRFIHPDMRAFESWGNVTKDVTVETLKKLHVWNSVNGYRIFAHGASHQELAPFGQRTRRYYDSFPEIFENQMSHLDVKCEKCISQLFDGAYPVVTVGNNSAEPVNAVLTLPIAGTILFDRVNSSGVNVIDGKTSLKLAPYEFRAFEVRP